MLNNGGIDLLTMCFLQPTLNLQSTIYKHPSYKSTKSLFDEYMKSNLQVNNCEFLTRTQNLEPNEYLSVIYYAHAY